MSEILQTQEVGSLAKPNWRVAAVNNREVTDAHIADAVSWAQRLELDYYEAQLVLSSAQREIQEDWQTTPGVKTAVKWLAARFAVKLQEKAGLDIIYDGEQDRSEMYQHAIEHSRGFAWRGRLRAFDHKSYRKAASIDTPGLSEPWHFSELERLKVLTNKQIKVPITGAYTLADWSFDEHYRDKRELVLDIASNLIRPNIVSLLNQGVDWIQIDEPAATTVPHEVPLFVEAFNESVAGLLGKFSVHICFSDYSLLFPHVEQLENCSQFSLEFANRDGYDLGLDATNRPAYEILKHLNIHSPDVAIGLGVTSVHDDRLESAELVRDRVLRAVDILGDPAKVFPSPDCGLRTRSWEIAYEKLARTVEGTQLAKEILGVEV